MKFYVYKATGLNNEILYIGKGGGDRYKHCNSGISHCFHLNEYFFKNGSESINTKIVREFDCEIEALEHEKVCIQTLKPMFNKVLTVREVLTDYEKLQNGLLINFKRLGSQYYDAFHCNDVQTMHLISQQCPRLVDYVEELGIEALRTCGFQESKVKRKYNESVGASKLAESPKKIQKCLKFNSDERYTLREIKEALTQAYSKLKLTKTAKAKDIKQYYHVKRTNINGSSGYKIVGEI